MCDFRGLVGFGDMFVWLSTRLLVLVGDEVNLNSLHNGPCFSLWLAVLEVPRRVLSVSKSWCLKQSEAGEQ